MSFSIGEMRLRAIRRVAEVLSDHFEEGRDGHSRLFEVLVPDEFVIDGVSARGGGYREHVVPCAAIRAGCKAMYADGASIEQVASMIDRYLRIVLITSEEADLLNKTPGLKAAMPTGWKFGRDDALARLDAVGIKVVDHKPNKAMEPTA